MTTSSETQLITRMCEYWHNLPGQQSGPPKMSGPTFDNLPEFFSDASKTPEDFYVHSTAGDMVLLQYKSMMKIADLAEFLITKSFHDPDIDLPNFFNTKMASSLADDLSSFVAMADRQGRSGLDRLMSEKIPSGSSVDEVILLYENRSANRHIVAVQVLEDKAGHSSALIRVCTYLTSKYSAEIHDRLFPIEAKKKRTEKEMNKAAAVAGFGGLGVIILMAASWYLWPNIKSGASRAINYAGSFSSNQADNADPSDLNSRVKKYFEIIYTAGGMMPKQNFPESVVMINRRHVLTQLEDFYYAPLYEKEELSDLFTGEGSSALTSRSFERTLQGIFTSLYTSRFVPSPVPITIEAKGDSQAMYEFFYNRLLQGGEMTPEQVQEAALKSKAPFERLEQARFKTGIFSSSRITGFKRFKVDTPIAEGYDTGRLSLSQRSTSLHAFKIDDKWYLLGTKPFYDALHRVIEQSKKE